MENNLKRIKRLQKTLKSFKEGNKIFKYDGTNQNTLSAWIREDTSEEENVRVNVKDNFGSYTWDRKKSNKNVRGKVEDGKGFSFFFARYAYSDEFKYIDESYVTNDNPNYSSFFASVPFGKITQLETIKKDPDIMKRLDPANSVLLVIDIPSSKENTVLISATYTNKKEILVSYIQNASKILVERHAKEQRMSENRNWLKEKLETSVEEELYKRFINGYEQFNEFLSVLKSKN
jgi:hypothetical protein